MILTRIRTNPTSLSTLFQSRCVQKGPTASSSWTAKFRGSPRPPPSPPQRPFSSSSFDHVPTLLDTQALQQSLSAWGPSMAASLQQDGYWTNYPPTDDAVSTENDDILPMDVIRALRQQSQALREEGRFEPSWSEKTLEGGETVRFDKEGVYACEPDGGDYETAPDMLLYMSTLLSTLPVVLNQEYNNSNNSKNREKRGGVPLNLSNQAFNAKLAVTLAGGSSYPLHIDNTLGVTGNDTRKLTCILYLNPEYHTNDGGELELMLLDQQCVHLSPRGGRLLLFWSDDMPHQVLPHKPDSTASEFDRYALTLWIPDGDPRNIQDPDSKFQILRSDEFQGETW
eukprot:CAMPEP_0172444362 /NCGR_PEP_ID=MMETSP1065-20121228/4414_1 /TAXON_ID=265537 /ORGANISM="Amphiprora paludosa, Strain CCMP125" /LENGTH=339 /DNA_ID=CAMNT_0013194861 /DNA_START=161 /DNA_END=1177 /DNA_ORIENTATION=-